MNEVDAGIEHDTSNVSLILLRGVEDLPDSVSGIIANSINATPFNSDWKNLENFDQKLERLDALVNEIKVSGTEVVFIGVSAGGGLGMAYILEHPEKVRHLFSLDGLVDPNIRVNGNKGHMAQLCRDNPSFKEMTEFLTNNLHLSDGTVNENLIEKYHLKDTVSTYSSNSDEIVPIAVTEPSWIVKKHRVGGTTHAVSIARTLIYDLKKQLVQLEISKFN